LASAENCANLIKGKTSPERLDVTNIQGIAVFMRLVAERHEHIDILINNTGYLLSAQCGTKGSMKPPKKTSKKLSM
jgi:NADP-dependent 3-hydroxy acid dehydrogenase YdfG